MAPQDDSIAPIRPISGDRAYPLGYEVPSRLARASGPGVGGEGQRTTLGDAGGSGSGIDRENAFKSRFQIEQAQLSIEKDEPSGKMVVRLKDPRSGDLIRQIPSEEMLRIARAMSEHLGLLVDGHL